MRAVLSPKDSEYHSQARAWADEAPDPLEAPELYNGIRIKRLVAYGIDFIVISLLLVAVWVIGSFLAIITLGLLFPVLALSFFNPRGRCLHDFLAGTVTVNDLHLARLRAPRQL